MHDATALDAIIRPDCRRNRGDLGALDEAFERIRAEYLACLEGWRADGKEPTFHVKLGIERHGEPGTVISPNG